MTGKNFLALAALVMGMGGTAQAATIQLSFEGILTGGATSASIARYYEGGTSNIGTSHSEDIGVRFGGAARAICLNTLGNTCSNASWGGTGAANTAATGLTFAASGTKYVNIDDGFSTQLSFFHSSLTEGSIALYAGLFGTGTLLGTYSVAKTTGTCGSAYGNAVFCPLTFASYTFAGLAKSVAFLGTVVNHVYDEFTFGEPVPVVTPPVEPPVTTPTPAPVPLAASLPLLATGMAGLFARGRFKKRRG